MSRLYVSTKLESLGFTNAWPASAFGNTLWIEKCAEVEAESLATDVPMEPQPPPRLLYRLTPRLFRWLHAALIVADNRYQQEAARGGLEWLEKWVADLQEAVRRWAVIEDWAVREWGLEEVEKLKADWERGREDKKILREVEFEDGGPAVLDVPWPGAGA